MNQDKEFYLNLKYNGFSWYGFIDGKHCFSKSPKRGKFIEVKISDDDIESGKYKEIMDEKGR